MTLCLLVWLCDLFCTCTHASVMLVTFKSSPEWIWSWCLPLSLNTESQINLFCLKVSSVSSILLQQGKIDAYTRFYCLKTLFCRQSTKLGIICVLSSVFRCPSGIISYRCILGKVGPTWKLASSGIIWIILVVLLLLSTMGGWHLLETACLVPLKCICWKPNSK